MKELEQLISKCDLSIEVVNGVKGCVIRGRGDYVFNSIFLPFAGLCDGASLFNSNEFVGCWSSTPDSVLCWGGSYTAWHFNWNYDYEASVSSRNDRYYGMPIRPVQSYSK